MLGNARSPAVLLPREHGAWAMLLLPFLAAVIIADSRNWFLVPALTAVLAAFAIRDPLVVLARQRVVWREPKPETRMARRALALWAALLAASGAALLAAVPALPLAALGLAGVLLTALAVWMTVRNRQRSTWLQVLSAAGLGSSALLAALVCEGGIAAWAWALWGLSSLHSAAGVLTVRARLQRIVDAKRAIAAGAWDTASARLAGWFRWGLVAAAGAGLALGHPWLAAAAMLSAAVHHVELAALRNPESLRTPLRRVGLRAMTVSIGFTALLVAGLR